MQRKFSTRKTSVIYLLRCDDVIRYPSVNCIGFCRLTAGSILFSKSLLNSKASSTRNGFNNMSLWPHKMTQALGEASRFTRRRPCGSVLLWEERRRSCSRRKGMLQGRGSEGLGTGALLVFSGCVEKSSSSSFCLDCGALRFWPLAARSDSVAPSAEASLLLCSWCSRWFLAFSSNLHNTSCIEWMMVFVPLSFPLVLKHLKSAITDNMEPVLMVRILKGISLSVHLQSHNSVGPHLFSISWTISSPFFK